MMREEGRVVAIEGDLAIISNHRKSACGGCHAEASCGTLSLGLGKRDLNLMALNRAGAAIGDRVVLEFSERRFRKVSFLVYGVPVIALFVVGALVRSLLLALGAEPRSVEGLAALAGLAALGGTLYLMQHSQAASVTDRSNLPVVASIIHEIPILTCSIDPTGNHSGCS